MNSTTQSKKNNTSKRTEWFDPEIDRYQFDFEVCSGWTQLDTSQDFSHYGNWVCPKTLKVMSFAEGDCTLYKCANEEDFKLTLTRLLQWHKDNSMNPKLDAFGENEVLLEGMGFGDWLYKDI